MRVFHNWVKSVLIDSKLLVFQRDRKIESRERSTQSKSVLDLACGKGGDYFKIIKACPGSELDYVGVDISKAGLEVFVERIQTDGKKKKNHHLSIGARTVRQRLGCVNLGSDNLQDGSFAVWDSQTNCWTGQNAGEAILVPGQRFDLVSMQFAIHYNMFQSSARLIQFFQSWSSHLDEGGFFVVTTMDAQVVRNYLKECSSSVIVVNDSLGRPTCKMAFGKDERNTLLQPN